MSILIFSSAFIAAFIVWNFLIKGLIEEKIGQLEQRMANLDHSYYDLLKKFIDLRESFRDLKKDIPQSPLLPDTNHNKSEKDNPTC